MASIPEQIKYLYGQVKCLSSQIEECCNQVYDFVPYTGANKTIDLNTQQLLVGNITATKLTINSVVNTTGIIVDMPLVNNNPTGGVPDAIRTITRGHNGASESLVSGVYATFSGNRNVGFDVYNAPSDSDVTNSFGFRVIFKDTSTTNIAYLARLGATEVFKVTDIGNVTANSFIKLGGLATQYLMADGSVSTGGGAGMPTNLAYVESETQGTITSSTGTSAIIPLAGQLKAGLISNQAQTIYGQKVIATGQLSFTDSGLTTNGRIKLLDNIWSLFDADDTPLLIARLGQYTFSNGDHTADLKLDLLNTTNRTYQFPDASGTFVLTSDLTPYALDANVVHKTLNETVAGEKTFTDIFKVENIRQFKNIVSADKAISTPFFIGAGAGNGWAGSYDTGYTHSPGFFANLVSSISLVSGTLYSVNLTITGRTAGSFSLQMGGTTTAGITASIVIPVLSSNTSKVTLIPTLDFDGTVVINITSVAPSVAADVYYDSLGAVTGEKRNSFSNSNNFEGISAGKYNVTGFGNIFSGYEAGMFNVSGNNNIYSGYQAGKSNATGTGNVFQGYQAGALSTESNNVATGYQAMSANIGGKDNMVLGYSALKNARYSNFNMVMGGSAGVFLNNGSTELTELQNSVLVGYNTTVQGQGDTNSIVIGYLGKGLGSNTTVIGNLSTLSTFVYGRTILGNVVDNGVDKLQVNGSALVDGLRYTKGFDISGQDLDTITNAGFYSGSGLPNSPNSLTGHFYITVERFSTNTDWVHQTATAFGISDNLPNRIYSRVKQNTAWQPWAEIITTANGGITGTGAAGQVAFWNGANTQTGDNWLIWDNASKLLGIGTGAPYRKLSLESPGPVYISFNDTTNNKFSIGSDVNGLIFFDDTNSTYIASFAKNTRNFLINTLSDNGVDKLQVNGSISGTKLTIPQVADDAVYGIKLTIGSLTTSTKPDAITVTNNGSITIGGLVASYVTDLNNANNVGFWANLQGQGSLGFLAKSEVGSNKLGLAYDLWDENNISLFSVNETGNLVAKSVAITGGLATEYLMADGSVLSGVAIRLINEGNGIGTVFGSYDRANYGNIGLDAFDFSYSDTASTVFGATGEQSFAVGINVVASGYNSTVFGYIADSGGNGDFVTGFNLKSRGYTNFVTGIGHDVTGTNATVVGQAAEIINDTILTFNDPNAIVFAVGNGTITDNDDNYPVLTRSTALLVRKNGNVEIVKGDLYLNGDEASINLYNSTGDSYWKFTSDGDNNFSITDLASGRGISIDFNNNLVANAFKKVGGLDTEYLMADGSVSTGSGAANTLALAAVSQTGTGNPVFNELKNTLGTTYTITRIQTGIYNIIFTSGMSQAVIDFTNGGTNGGVVNVEQLDNYTIQIRSYTAGTNTRADDIINNGSLTITDYI